MGKTMISARVDDELNARIEALAESSQRSKAFLISEALQNYVDRQNRLEAAIAEAVAGADVAAHWHSHGSVAKWANAVGTAAEVPLPEPDVYRPKT